LATAQYLSDITQGAMNLTYPASRIAFKSLSVQIHDIGPRFWGGLMLAIL